MCQYGFTFAFDGQAHVDALLKLVNTIGKTFYCGYNYDLNFII
jgi:hypothetical protein